MKKILLAAAMSGIFFAPQTTYSMQFIMKLLQTKSGAAITTAAGLITYYKIEQYRHDADVGRRIREVDQRVDTVHTEMVEFRGETNERHDGHDRRLDRLAEQYTTIDGRMTGLQSSFETMYGEQHVMHEEQAAFGIRLARTEDKVDLVQNGVTALYEAQKAQILKIDQLSIQLTTAIDRLDKVVVQQQEQHQETLSKLTEAAIHLETAKREIAEQTAAQSQHLETRMDAQEKAAAAHDQNTSAHLEALKKQAAVLEHVLHEVTEQMQQNLDTFKKESYDQYRTICGRVDENHTVLQRVSVKLDGLEQHMSAFDRSTWMPAPHSPQPSLPLTPNDPTPPLSPTSANESGITTTPRGAEYHLAQAQKIIEHFSTCGAPALRDSPSILAPAAARAAR